MEAPKKNYHCIVCDCFLLNTAVPPCGHTICRDCAVRISRCRLDRTDFVAANTTRKRAVQDVVQDFLLSEVAHTTGAMLAPAGTATFSLGSTTKPLTNPDAMQQARLRAFMHLLPPDPSDEPAADRPGEPAACPDWTCSQMPARADISGAVARWTLSRCNKGNGSARQCTIVWSGLCSPLQQLEHWCTSC